MRFVPFALLSLIGLSFVVVPSHSAQSPTSENGGIVGPHKHWGGPHGGQGELHVPIDQLNSIQLEKMKRHLEEMKRDPNTDAMKLPFIDQKLNSVRETLKAKGEMNLDGQTVPHAGDDSTDIVSPIPTPSVNPSPPNPSTPEESKWHKMRHRFDETMKTVEHFPTKVFGNIFHQTPQQKVDHLTKRIQSVQMEMEKETDAVAKEKLHTEITHLQDKLTKLQADIAVNPTPTPAAPTTSDALVTPKSGGLIDDEEEENEWEPRWVKHHKHGEHGQKENEEERHEKWREHSEEREYENQEERRHKEETLHKEGGHHKVGGHRRSHGGHHQRFGGSKHQGREERPHGIHINLDITEF